MKCLLLPVAALVVCASGSALRRAATDQCCFGISVSGEVQGPLGQSADGQNRIGPQTPSGVSYCIADGHVTDQNGRACVLSPPSTQFQCKDGILPTDGFDLTASGEFQYDTNSIFFACPADGDGNYNIYTSPEPQMTQCVQIGLSLTNGVCAPKVSSSSAASPSSSTPAAPSRALPSSVARSSSLTSFAILASSSTPVSNPSSKSSSGLASSPASSPLEPFPSPPSPFSLIRLHPTTAPHHAPPVYPPAASSATGVSRLPTAQETSTKLAAQSRASAIQSGRGVRTRTLILPSVYKTKTARPVGGRSTRGGTETRGLTIQTIHVSETQSASSRTGSGSLPESAL